MRLYEVKGLNTKLFSSHGCFQIYTMHHHREAIKSNLHTTSMIKQKKRMLLIAEENLKLSHGGPVD